MSVVPKEKKETTQEECTKGNEAHETAGNTGKAWPEKEEHFKKGESK